MSKITLCRNGKSLCYIRIKPKADKILQFAANELSRYLEKITNASVSVSNSCENLFPIELKIDKNLNNESSGKYDSALIDVRCDRICIAGENARSALFGVYSFLEEIGCLWTYPFEEHQVVPKIKNLKLRIGQKLISHRLKIRAVNLEPMIRRNRELIPHFIDWLGKNHFNALSTHPGKYGHGEDLWTTDVVRWEDVADVVVCGVKQRGIMLFQNVHTLHYFMPPEKYFKKHPDWYSLQNIISPRAKSRQEKLAKYLIRYFEDPTEGKHHYELPKSSKTRPKWLDANANMRVPAQICYSNKEAIKEYAKNVIGYLSRHREVDVIGLWPGDGGNFCQCEKCRNNPYAIFNAIRYVAGEIHKRFPDVLVEHLVYGGRAVYKPPRDDVAGDERMIVFLCCPDEIRSAWAKWLNRNNMIGYRGDYACADNYARQGMIAIVPEYAKNIVDVTVDEFQLKGVSSFYIDIDSWWISSLNMWLLAKASLSEPLEMELAIREYSKKYYGEYSRQAYEFLELSNDNDVNAIRNLLRKYKDISADDERFRLLYTYFEFRERILHANDLRESAHKVVSRSKGSALKKMLDVAKIEEQLLAMVQESYWRNDGLFNRKFFVCRRWERFEKDRKFCMCIK